MWEGLEQLIALQELDLAIARTDAALKAIPGQVQALEARLVQTRSKLDQAKAEAEDLQKLRRAKERELEDFTHNLKRRQARLFEVKTNQEYSAVLKEIEVLKEKISATEEEILLLLDRIEASTKAVSASEAEFKLEEAEFQRAKAAKEAEQADLEREQVALQKAREARIKGTEASLLQTYTKLFKSRDGLAVVPVKDGSCLGCHFTLRPQAYSEVRRNDRLITCENCQRILYFKG